MRRSRRRWTWGLASTAAIVVAATALSRADAPSGSDASSTTPTAETSAPLAPPPGATRVAALPSDRVTPRIAVDGDVAAWSTASSITVSAGGQLHQFSLGFMPRGLSVGHADGQTPVVLFAKCPPGKVRSTKRRGTCDLYRLSSLDASATPVPLTTLGPGMDVAGANTKRADELAPTLSGRDLLFARWPVSGAHASLIRRDVHTGHERVLPRGPLGSCRKSCAWDDQANGPLEASASATDRSYAQIWSFSGGPEGFGVDRNDQVRIGDLDGKPRDHLIAESFVDGAADGGSFYDDVQQIGDVTQVVLNTDDPPPAPGTHQDLLRVRGKVGSTYDDPVGRRVVSAAATPTTLWLVLEARALPAGTGDDQMPDDLCGAAVGGCVVESMPLPRFKRVAG